jgi:hypothetical protein
MRLTGTLTLNGHGNAAAVFIFQIGSSLVTASHSRVSLVNGAQACNVFWQVGSSATFGTATNFAGNVLALTSISAKTNAAIRGRLLAQTGEVSLESNIITAPTCLASTSGGSTTTIPSGAPQTGFGGAAYSSGSEWPWFVAMAGLLVIVLGIMEARRSRAKESRSQIRHDDAGTSSKRAG